METTGHDFRQDIRTDMNNTRSNVQAAADNLQRDVNRAKQEEAYNPASLSANPDKKVARNKPHVKPPFIDVPFGKFLTYLVLGLCLMSLYYVWKLQRYANEVGGYWNAVVGAKGSDVAAVAASKAADSAESVVKSTATAASATGGSKPGTKVGRRGKAAAEPTKGSKEDIQSQVFRLAQSLGVKPAELSDAIRHLTDPTAPKPGAGAARADAGKEAQVQAEAAAAAASSAAASDEPGFLSVMGEALLD